MCQDAPSRCRANSACPPSSRGSVHSLSLIHILLYHYDACFDTLFEGGSRVEEQAPFVELMKDHDYNREVTLSVRGMTGRFAIRKYRLTSEEYASRYRDFPLPPADRLSAETLRVLNGTLAPEMSLNLLELDGAYYLTLKLAPFEILLLRCV